MNTNDNTLALRRHSIRTLTASELRVVHGGEGDNICPPPRPRPTSTHA
jgi:hypothetical protein